MGEVADPLRQVEDSVSSPLQACTSAMEKPTQPAEKNKNILQKLLEKLSKIQDRLSSPPTAAHAAAIKRRHPFLG